MAIDDHIAELRRLAAEVDYEPGWPNRADAEWPEPWRSCSQRAVRAWRLIDEAAARDPYWALQRALLLKQMIETAREQGIDLGSVGGG
jgi:hypothetical protein